MGEREKEEKRKNSKAYFLDLWRSIGQNSSSQELKFIYSTRATRMYQNRRISLKIQKRRFGGNQKGWVRRPSQGSNDSSTLQEVGILPTLVYFHPKGSF